MEELSYHHVQQPTHFRSLQQANILDIVLTNEEHTIDSIDSHDPIGKCHHVFLFWIFHCYIERRTIVKKYHYDKANFDGMRDALVQMNWNDMYIEEEVEEMWKILVHKVQEVIARDNSLMVTSAVFSQRNTQLHHPL